MARMLTQPKAFFNAPMFQGRGKTRLYFEGWYYKCLNADATTAIAVIPGIAMDPTGNRHAFIQVLDGKRGTAVYHTFPAAAFQASHDRFEVRIDQHYFSAEKLQIDLPELQADLTFSGITPWPAPFYSPGIMGPFSFVPFMECYHGIVSMDHSIRGEATLHDQSISFDGGRGYMEKDWGRSFPSAYIWMQSNHFENTGISLKASVAKIPWIGSSFVGFIAGLLIDKKLIRFTTYNFSQLKDAVAGTTDVHLHFSHPTYNLRIKAHRDHATELAAPIHGFMEGRIEESMTSTLEVSLENRKTGGLIWSGTGRHAGLEVAGNIAEIARISTDK